MSAITTRPGDVPTECLPKGHELFGHTRLTEIIQEYLGETPNLDQVTRLFDLFSRQVVHLNDPNVLKLYVREDLVKAALGVITPHLGRKPVLITNQATKHTLGFSFPIDPEILAYTMDLARNKIAVELGGAFGENAMLLAFGDAERVYMSDLCSKQIINFQNIVKLLPTEIQAKLESAEGNCFNLLKQKPALKGKVSVILCRNLIPRFSDAEMKKFFSLLTNLLEPGGRAILTARSIYDLEEKRELFQTHPQVNLFAHINCSLHVTGKEPKNLFADLIPILEPLPSMEPQEATVCAGPQGAKWPPQPNVIQKFHPSLQKAIKTICQDHQATVKDAIKSVQFGKLVLDENLTRLFSKENLAALAEKHGFTVVSTFVTSIDGHLVGEAEICEKGFHAGVIIQKPA